MKKTLRSAAILLAALMTLSTASVLASCDFGEDDNKGTDAPTDVTATESVTEGTLETETDAPEIQTSAPVETDKETDKETESATEAVPSKVDYTVSVKSIGGAPITKLQFYIYKGEDDLTAYGQTDESGVGTVSLEPADDYTVELSATSLVGYAVEARYSFGENKALEITLVSSVIEDSDLTGVRYKVGDIIRDFTVTTTEGEEFVLSEVLAEKKGVLINFFYTTCSPCVTEFPYMLSAYEQYSDDIAVIAIDNYGGDTESAVELFKSTMGLTFDVSKDYSALGSAFGVSAYPTSILVDRYGVICLIEAGGLTSEKPFVAAFKHLSSDSYVQRLLGSFSDLTPTERPNVEMPSSEEIGAALSGEGFEAVYTPATDESDAEYSWPFLVGEKNGRPCVYSSNSELDSSFATLHAKVDLKAGEALAVDWFASSELGSDVLYVLVDGVDIYTLSGISEEWATCYPYVAQEDGEYDVAFLYWKDESINEGDDCIYLSNLRKVSADDIDTATYIPREAATRPNANGLGYQNYVDAVYNENDGYYHVGSPDGALLLVNLMGDTQLSETPLNILGYNGELVDSEGNIYEDLVDYCNYSINGDLYGHSPVTKELRALLERAAELVGFETGNDDQWLQACMYYEAFGTDEQLEDPVAGIAFFAAFDTVVSTGEETRYNTVSYDGRVIMPRGYKYKFVPEVSGAYIILSQSEHEVNGWIFDENYEIMLEATGADRAWGHKTLDDGSVVAYMNVPTVGEVLLDEENAVMIAYLEAGKTYYIDIAYYDIYREGTFTFTVNYIGETYDQLHLASPGYFTYYESTTGQINETLAGGIEVALGDDGYYHHKLEDGTLGSVVYADFSYTTGLLSHSLKEMIELGAFNFALSENDQEVIAKLKELDGDVAACREYYKKLWGDSYAEYAEIYALEEILAGKYHGNGVDRTEEILHYIDMMIDDESTPELVGCVAVDAALADILQDIMDKYTFEGVRNSWTKLCYYYKALAPDSAE